MRKVLRSRVIAFLMAFCMMISMISTDMLGGAMQVQAETGSVTTTDGNAGGVMATAESGEVTWVDGFSVGTLESGYSYLFDFITEFKDSYSSQGDVITNGTYGALAMSGFKWHGTSYGIFGGGNNNGE